MFDNNAVAFEPYGASVARGSDFSASAGSISHGISDFGSIESTAAFAGSGLFISDLSLFSVIITITDLVAVVKNNFNNDWRE